MSLDWGSETGCDSAVVDRGPFASEALVTTVFRSSRESVVGCAGSTGDGAPSVSSEEFSSSNGGLPGRGERLTSRS